MLSDLSREYRASRVLLRELSPLSQVRGKRCLDPMTKTSTMTQAASIERSFSTLEYISLTFLSQPTADRKVGHYTCRKGRRKGLP